MLVASKIMFLWNKLRISLISANPHTCVTDLSFIICFWCYSRRWINMLGWMLWMSHKHLYFRSRRSKAGDRSDAPRSNPNSTNHESTSTNSSQHQVYDGQHWRSGFYYIFIIYYLLFYIYYYLFQKSIRLAMANIWQVVSFLIFSLFIF